MLGLSATVHSGARNVPRLIGNWRAGAMWYATGSSISGLAHAQIQPSRCVLNIEQIECKADLESRSGVSSVQQKLVGRLIAIVGEGVFLGYRAQVEIQKPWNSRSENGNSSRSGSSHGGSQSAFLNGIHPCLSFLPLEERRATYRDNVCRKIIPRTMRVIPARITYSAVGPNQA